MVPLFIQCMIHFYLFCLLRFLCRCILLPCAVDSSNVHVILDVMDDLVKRAVAAFPVALCTGKKLRTWLLLRSLSN